MVGITVGKGMVEGEGAYMCAVAVADVGSVHAVCLQDVGQVTV